MTIRDPHTHRNEPRDQLIAGFLRATFAICDANQVARDSALAAAIYQTVERLESQFPPGPETVIRVPATLGDPAAREALSAQVAEAAAGGAHRIVLDFSEATNVDSGGLGAIVSIAKRARQAGATVAMANVGHELRTVIDLTGLGGIVAGDEAGRG